MGTQPRDSFTEAAESFLRFAKGVTATLKEWLETDGIPEFDSVRVEFNERGPTHKIYKEVSYASLWYRRDPSLVRAKELAAECVQLHVQTGVLHPPELSDREGNRIVTPTFDQVLLALVPRVLEPVFTTLERVCSLEVAEAEFVRTYEQFRAGWLVTDPVQIATTPLINFTAETSLKITSFFELAPFTPSEKTALLGRRLVSLDLFGLHLSAMANFKLVGQFSNAQGAQTNFGSIVHETRNTITALRLLKRGEIGASEIIYKSILEYDQFMGGTVLNEFRPRRFGETYVLKANDAAPALSLIDLLRGGDQTGVLKPLAVAFRRFNQSYGRDLGEDRLIDLTIALESCVLSKVEEELAFRLSLRGAALLRRERNPHEVQTLLLALYAVRSAIVHGGKTLSELEKELKPVLTYFQNCAPHEFPALGLGHEMAHADQPWYWELAGWLPWPDYDNVEERRVITGLETEAARALGEGTRTSHGGTPYWVPTPTSR